MAKPGENTAWSLRDKIAGIPNPKELTNSDLQAEIKKINKLEKSPTEHKVEKKKTKKSK